MTTETKTDAQHGGKRHGAGRPRNPESIKIELPLAMLEKLGVLTHLKQLLMQAGVSNEAR